MIRPFDASLYNDERIPLTRKLKVERKLLRRGFGFWRLEASAPLRASSQIPFPSNFELSRHGMPPLRCVADAPSSLGSLQWTQARYKSRYSRVCIGLWINGGCLGG